MKAIKPALPVVKLIQVLTFTIKKEAEYSLVDSVRVKWGISFDYYIQILTWKASPGSHA